MTARDDTSRSDAEDDLETLTPDMGWKGLAVLGVVMLIGGFLAFLNPFAASLAAEAVAGAAFLAAGEVQLWLTVSDKSKTSGDRWLSGALGLALVLFALAGLVTLTVLVALFFTVLGALRVGLAWHLRPAQGWGWIMASGVMSLLLAALIVLGLPGAALGILGLFLGIDLTMAGAVTLALAWQKKSDA